MIALQNKLTHEEKATRNALIDKECLEFVEYKGLKIPKRPYNKWRFVELIPFQELYTTYRNHHRLRVFVEKGLKCAHPACNRTATHLIVTQDHSGALHIDLVDADFNLMNVDHIKPKSAGGGKEMGNKQPMCERHNTKKSNKLVPY